MWTLVKHTFDPHGEDTVVFEKYFEDYLEAEIAMYKNIEFYSGQKIAEAMGDIEMVNQRFGDAKGNDEQLVTRSFQYGHGPNGDITAIYIITHHTR